MGKKMVFEGDKTSCGATFIGNQTLAFSTTGSKALGMDLINSLVLNKDSHEFAERFLLQSEKTNEPVRNGNYEVYKNGQLILTGTIDENGMTQPITGKDGEEIEIRIVGDHNE